LKLKNQFLLNLLVFGIIFAIIGGSLVNTQQEISQLNDQENAAKKVQVGITDLNYLSNNYYLYRGESQVISWQARFSTIYGELANIYPASQKQQVLLDNVRVDLQRLNDTFIEAIFNLEKSQTQTVESNLAFQSIWDQLSVLSQATAFDSFLLSQSISAQANQLQSTSSMLIFGLLGGLGIFLALNYLIAYRKTLKSISNLNVAIKEFSSGNLKTSFDTNEKNEVGQLSVALSNMAINLRKAKVLNESLARFPYEDPDVVIRVNSNMEILYANPACQQLSKFYELKLNSNIPEHWKNFVGEALSANRPLSFEDTFHEQTFLFRVVPITSEGYVNIYGADITERKNAEEALKESEQLYRTIFDNSQDGFQLNKVIYDENGKPVDCLFLKVNAAYELQNGIKAEDIVGKTAMQLAPNTEQMWFDLFNEVAKTEKTKHVENYNELTKRWYDFYVFPYAEDTVGSLLRDVTARKNLEKRLQDSERLAAIGATAGMVGHDIRNPLQAIVSDLYIARQETTEMSDSEAKKGMLEIIDSIEENVFYINKIVNDLQDYAKPLNPRVQESDLKTIINQSLVSSHIPDKIKTLVLLDSGAEKIIADSDFLKRIVNNLVLNSVQAMPNGGKLTIKSIKDKETSDIILTVSDTGVGIPDDVKGKLFTPMFTTKSKGQGFGLAVVKRMTEGLGGTISFDSQTDKGTTFTMRFPPPRAKR
jgi:PAS domain S-box-containing protein